MANTILSPNMELPVPVVGVDPGPQYASDVNGCLAIIDQHDHSPGNGVKVTPTGLNINVDLTMQGNNLTVIRSSRYQPQPFLLSLPADLGCVYVQNVDLYYNDVNGNQIRLTQSGAVAGTPGSIANLVPPASASYVASDQTFVWQSDANVPANMDFASATFRNLTAGSAGVTVSPPNALGSDYSLTLPQLPGVQSFMTLDASGNMAAPWTVDNLTLDIQSNQVEVKASGIGTTQLANGSVTKAKLASLGQAVGTPVAAFSTTSGSFTSTGLSVTIATTGRPVFIGLFGNGGNLGSLGMAAASGGGGSANFQILRDGSTDIARYTYGLNNGTGSGTPSGQTPSSSFNAIDVSAGAGTHTYTVNASSSSGAVSAQVFNTLLIAYEL